MSHSPSLCSFVRPDGSRCGAFAGRDSAFCFMHDPALADTRMAARRRGAAARNARPRRRLHHETRAYLNQVKETYGSIPVLLPSLMDLFLSVRDDQVQVWRALSLGRLADTIIRALKAHASTPRLEADAAPLRASTSIRAANVKAASRNDALPRERTITTAPPPAGATCPEAMPSSPVAQATPSPSPAPKLSANRTRWRRAATRRNAAAGVPAPVVATSVAPPEAPKAPQPAETPKPSARPAVPLNPEPTKSLRAPRSSPINEIATSAVGGLATPPKSGVALNPSVRSGSAASGIRNPELGTRNPELETRNPEPETRNPEPETRNPKPPTRNAPARPPDFSRSPGFNCPRAKTGDGRHLIPVTQITIVPPLPPDPRWQHPAASKVTTQPPPPQGLRDTCEKVTENVTGNITEHLTETHADRHGT